jgi:hypothetical protein
MELTSKATYQNVACCIQCVYQLKNENQSHESYKLLFIINIYLSFICQQTIAGMQKVVC